MNKPAKLFIEKCGSIDSAISVCSSMLKMYKDIILILSDLNQRKIYECKSKIRYYTSILNYCKSKI